MARAIDTQKLEDVKKSAIKLIVEKGYGGASISSIAKKAQVAEGYLYRFYKGKEELVSDLLNTKVSEIANKLEESIEKSQSFDEIIASLIKNIFSIAEKSEDEIKFIYVMMNDYSFSVHSNLKQRIKGLCMEAINKAKQLNNLNYQIEPEDLYMFSVIYPIQFINLRLKEFFGTKSWTKQDVDRITNIVIKTLIN